VRGDAMPDDLRVWLEAGALAQRLDRGELADDVLARIVRRFPDEPRVALLRAGQLRDAGDTQGARAALADVRAAAGQVPELRYALAAEYDALGDPAMAERVLAEGPQDLGIQALRATLLAKAEDKVALDALY